MSCRIDQRAKGGPEGDGCRGIGRHSHSCKLGSKTQVCWQLHQCDKDLKKYEESLVNKKVLALNLLIAKYSDP